jgi:hypothetical protein
VLLYGAIIRQDKLSIDRQRGSVEANAVVSHLVPADA